MKRAKCLLLLILLLGYTESKSQFIEWSKEFSQFKMEDQSYNDPQRIFSIQLKGSDILVVHNSQITLDLEYMKNGYRYDSLVLYRINSLGQLVWRKALEFAGRGKAYAATATDDSGFACCVAQGTFLSFFKFDKNGNLQSLKQWPKPVQKMYPCNITVGPDKQYYMLTAEFYFNRNIPVMSFYTQNIFDVFYNLIKIDQSGNIKWIKAAGRDIRSSSELIFVFQALDTAVIRGIELDHILDGDNGAINLVNNRPYFYDTSYGYGFLEIYLQRFDTNGNTLINKTFVDSFKMGNEVMPNYSYKLKDNFCKTGNGYLFNYRYAFYLSDSLPSIDTVLETVYYQDFDYNGNRTDSIIHQKIRSYWDIHNDYPHLPLAKDAAGNYWSLNDHLWLWPSIKGNLSFHQYNSNYELQNDIQLSSYTLNTDLVMRRLFPAPDGGILAVHIKDYGDYTINEPYNKGIWVSKIGNHGNAIHYQIYIDWNRNGIKDAGDTTFSDAALQIEHKQHTTEYNFDNGKFELYPDTGTYTSRLVSYYQYLKYYDIIPAEDTTRFTTYGNHDTVTFRLLTIPNIQDLQVAIVPATNARPGFESYYTLLLENYGTDTTHNIILKFLKDPRQTIISADPSYTVVDDTLIWPLEYRMPYYTFPIEVICKNNTPPVLNQGDTLVLKAWILPLERDSAKTDNFFLLKQTVSNSFDPNDKSEAHGEGITTSQLANQDYLYYTIRFQNTGNAVAYNVVIKDTLSELLDWSTFEMLHSWHGYKLELTDKRYLTWTFYNIYLADSATSEPWSHGYVTFRIKPKSGLSVSDVITNRASIIFDFNLPIVTNTATTQILQERVTIVKNNEIKSIKLYPSPTDSWFTMDINLTIQKKLFLSIKDMSGKAVYAKNISGNTGKNSIQIDISGQPNGIYLIQLNDEAQNFYYGKVVKQ